MPRPRVLIRRLRPGAVLPKYMTAAAAGMDLSACLEAPVVLQPGARAAVATGLAIALPAGYEAQVRARSGLARQHGVTVVNGIGTIDADYTGEITVLLINHGAEPLAIEQGHRIAQLVIAPVVQADFEEVEALPETERGSGGFGSTGR